MPTPTFDPRHLVTPDAFSVSDKVLGLPLATGRRRLVAFAIDGILVALLASLGWKILGVLLAFFFFRIATKGGPKTSGEPGAAARAAWGVGRGFRYSVGCLGGFILFVVFIFGTGALESVLRGDSQLEELFETGTGVLGLVRESQTLGNATSAQAAEEAAVELGLLLLRLDASATVSDAMETVETSLPPVVEADAVAFLARVESRIRNERRSGTGTAVNLAEQTPDTLNLESALAAYAASLDNPEDTTAASLVSAARARIAAAVAGDSLAAQAVVIADLREDLRRQRDEAEQARRAAEESSGVFGWFVDTLDELGLTFGWGALYFATLLTWFQGRTPGKRLMGLRVIRLDGEPISLFIAFERVGGYAAGVATGLLGFAQMLWDPNRQAIHDKIAGTVVIMDGKERLPGAAAPGR